MIGTDFYASGLRFSCKRCSACCRHDSGYVFLSEKDIQKLTKRLSVDDDAFIQAYCRWVAGRQGRESLSLKEKSNFDCIFWDSGCTVYQERPLQCRTFPFWESIVISGEIWEIAASNCPGMNSGELHTMEAIRECVAMRADEPIISKQRSNVR